jgi:hypothetical protein
MIDFFNRRWDAPLVTDPIPLTQRPPSGPIRIGNASGFYGDRANALQEMLTGGALDVLTGDYLAELTMLILGRDRLKDPASGYAKTFLRQLETTIGLAADQGVRIVTNAGGLNPAGLASAVRALAEKLGLAVRVAHVEGDDLRGRAAELGLGDPLAANAYLGGWGIAACLDAGADIVVTGRVTDASLVLGPAAAHFGWGRTDYDALAGAVVAGHIIECGPQATGGNYSFFTEIADLRRPGFPIAEVYADGSSVITKHAGTGGAVTVGTVTEQLLYEIAGARYAGPDVTTRFDSLVLTQEAPDRVRVSGAVGEPPPPTLKVGLNAFGGFRNEVEFVLTGLDIEAKAELVRAQLSGLGTAKAGTAKAGTAGSGTANAGTVEWTLVRSDRPDADTEETAAARLRCVVRSSDPKVAGRAFTGAAIELALASYPGFHVTAPPGEATPYGVFTSAYVDAVLVEQIAVSADGTRESVPAADATRNLEPAPEPAIPDPLPPGRCRTMPLGTVAGARSGDKGGSANVGVWVRTDEAWRWLAHTLTVEEFRRLLPETADLAVTRHVLPNLRAVNFVVEGILGEGVASRARFDPQAKALGEWLRSRHVEIPESLL